jgi:hypothetical protein
MTSGPRLEKLDLPRSVGGFHGVQAYSRVFQAPSYCSPGPSMAMGWTVPGSVPGAVA